MTDYARNIEVGLKDIGHWRPTIEQVRDACLEGRVVAMNVPTVGTEHWVPRDVVETTVTKVYDAVSSGRLIDCGDLPNDVIKLGGKRGGLMYSDRLMGHPFTLPWVLYHTWEEGSSVYLIELCDDDPAGGCTAITELDPIELRPFSAGSTKVLCIGDRVMLTRSESNFYTGFSSPSSFRYAYVDTASKHSIEGAALNNCLDPFVTALLLLHTDGIPVMRIEPSVKLNRARVKSGKAALPSILRIVSGPYVTALQARQHRQRGVSKGGTHASPVFHWRIGHWRYYQDGHQPATALPCKGERAPWRIRIRDSVVNANGEARQAFLRSHYSVQR